MKRARIYLSGQAFVAYALWQVVGIVGVLFPALLGIYAAGMGLLILLLAADFRTLPGDGAFTGALEGPGTPELGTEFTLRGALSLTGERSLRTRAVTAQAPQSRRLAFQSGTFDKKRRESAHNELALEISASGRSLGYEEISLLRAMSRSQAGFWLKSLDIEIEPYAFRVSPAMRKMPEESFTELVSTQRQLFQGSRLLMRGRTVDQFHSIRKYHYPDSIRHLDHKKTAKFGQLMTRTYESYHSHHIIIALDVGRAMLGEVRGSPKHDYYLSVVLALTHAALDAGDRVSFLAFSQKPHIRISKARSARLFQPIYRGEAIVQPREEDSNYAVLTNSIGGLTGQRAILLLLTDLSHPFVQNALLQFLPVICRTHLTVALSLLDRGYDLPTRISGLSGRRLDKTSYARLLYAYWMNRQLELFSRKLARVGGGALTISEEYWMSSASRVFSLLRRSIKA